MASSSTSKSHSLIWESTLSEIKAGMAGLSISGKPKIVNSPYSDAVLFNGIDDAFFLENNPLKGLSSFTIEAIVRQDPDGPEEQRFLHIGGTDSDRLLLETRTTNENKWYLDTFILCGESKKALIDPALLHPTGKWYHVVLTLDEKGKMSNFINGKKELDGEVIYKPINSGAMSIGMRQNKVSWFKGVIYKIRISRGVLEPKEFMTF